MRLIEEDGGLCEAVGPKHSLDHRQSMEPLIAPLPKAASKTGSGKGSVSSGLSSARHLRTTAPGGHLPTNRLPAGMDVDVLDGDLLLAHAARR
jgi:hypothetical protein